MEKTMKKEVGLWIDHRKAVIVAIENKGIVTQTIKSNVDEHIRFSSGTHSKSSSNSQGSTAEDVRDRQFGDQLENYYDRIITIIRDADSILILGPGEAKVEFENLLRHKEHGGQIVGIETADKMTDPQIKAKVKDHFHI
jgi:stalled ribosome rescue protein Dom34